ncbi:MAG: exopolysaccharide biosynthesis polyprenyl glycosylphosphotransferase [Patescibacteria group bacterium]
MRRYVKLQQFSVLAGDIIVLYISLVLMLFIRYGNLAAQLPRSHFLPFSIIFAFWIIIFYIVGLYDPSALRNSKKFNARFGLALTLNFFLAALFFYFLPLYEITPRANLLIFLAIFGSAAYVWRSTYNTNIQFRGPLKRIIILGNTKLAQELAHYLQEHSQLGYEIAETITSQEIYSNKERLLNALQEQNAHLVVVPRHIKEDKTAYEALGQKLDHAHFIDLKTIYEEIFNKIPLEELGSNWFGEGISEDKNIYEILKRPLDIMLACLLSALLLPIALVIVFAIKMTAHGSAFFTQTRVGVRGRKFTLWKFRTMMLNAEQFGPKWAKPDDVRVTPIGKILRKTHLDELPQLWNILWGDLSFVGPRPERPEFTATLEEKIPYYDFRHMIRPGLTGWAQINYPYGSSFEDSYQKLEYDLYYLKHRAILLDISILMKTIRHIFVSA